MNKIRQNIIGFIELSKAAFLVFYESPRKYLTMVIVYLPLMLIILFIPIIVLLVLLIFFYKFCDYIFFLWRNSGYGDKLNFITGILIVLIP